jgi:O-antigen/teichoic acid export membrane protein
MTVRRSLALATVSNYVTVLIAFVTNIIIARHLTPLELGIFAISIALAGLLDALREGGVNAYVIQHKSDALNVLRSAFTAASVLSLVSALLLWSLAPLAGDVFNTTDITTILWIIGLGFLAYPFTATVTATLQRDMRFQSLLTIEVTASLVQSATALALLFLGFGVLSLAIAVAVSSAVRAIISLWIVRDLRRFRIQFSGVPDVLRFSAIATISLILRQLKDGAFALIAGRVIGPAPVGLADRSKALISLYDKIISGIYPVVLPAFAELHRTGLDSVAPLLRGQALLNLMAMGVYGFLIIAAEPTLVFLYGEQWRAAAAFVPPMMLAALFGSALERLSTPIYIAHGRIDIVFKIQAFLAPVTVLALITAVPFGVMPALWALVATALLGALADLYFLPKLIVVKRGALVRPFVNAAMVTLPALLSGYAASALARFLELETVQYLMLVGPLYVAAFVMSAFMFKHPLAEELQRLGTYRQKAEPDSTK